MSRSLLVVAPRSLEVWLGSFLCPASTDLVRYVGERPLTRSEVAELQTASMECDRIELLSGHDSLLRDRGLATELRQFCGDVEVQSARATALGINKLEQKEFYESHGFDTPRWGTRQVPRTVGQALIKSRTGTQSEGLRLADAGETPSEAEYWEEFVPGVEYSVVTWLSRPRSVVLPIVEKGETGLDLTPPWKRLRVSPARLSTSDAEYLQGIALEICLRAEVNGFCEVEFVRRGYGAFSVLEVNPRISGTLRIASLTARVPIFSLHELTALDGCLPARGGAVEVPYDGSPSIDAGEQIFATSRLTVGGASVEDALYKLANVQTGPLHAG